jgi:RNA polymerase sigma-70 factor (ECF subfamily)
MVAPMEVQTLERLKIGDQAALETVFNLYAAKLCRVAQRILGDATDSEEVIQDVFWTVYRKANTFKGESKFSTWLYRLTVNAALGRIRKRKQQSEIEYQAYLPKFHSDGHHWARPVVDWSDTLDEKYAEHEITVLVGNALDQLKPIDKSVVVLSDMEGFADREIAVVLQLTVSAVKARLHRARLFLRGKLAAQLGGITRV